MSSLVQLVRDLRRPKILLLGDLILDHFVNGEVQRISPEAPIPVLDVQSEKFELGGVGNVAANVASMGGEAFCVGVMGDDIYAKILRSRLRAAGISDRYCLVEKKRPTTLKTRHTSQVHQMLRVDRETRHALSGSLLQKIVRSVPALVRRSQLVILSDYGKGALAPELIQAVIRAARAQKKIVLVDPKGKDFSRYRGATLITPNRTEAEAVTGISIEDDAACVKAAKKLIQEFQFQVAVITLGKDGVFFLTRKGEKKLIPTEARSVFDVTGAGDTVISQLGVFLANGTPLEDAIRLANIAAGIVVGKFGTATVSRKELLAHLDGGEAGHKKILTDKDLDAVLTALRREGRRVVFTNGCFDLLHAGHVQYLAQARSYGDALIVGVNGDRSVRKMKGDPRPFVPLEDRLAVLAGLQSVDYVIPFAQDTPKKLIERVTPDVLVKGEDWKDQGVVGREWVESHGGKVVLAKLKPGRSTSGIVDRIAKDLKAKGEK